MPSSRASDSQVLAFGDRNWSIRRQEFRGPSGRFRPGWCNSAAWSIADGLPHGDTADAAEQDVLNRLAAEKPIAEEPGKWRLYQWSEGGPIVIGTRVVPATAAKDNPCRKDRIAW